MRVSGKTSNVPEEIHDVFAQQESKWGEVLQPYQVYARRPSVFSAIVNMWASLEESGLLPGELTTLINRRVASLNGCVF